MAARLYSLFEKDGRHWRRLSMLAFTKDVAVLHWQSALLAPWLGAPCSERMLRPVKPLLVEGEVML